MYSSRKVIKKQILAIKETFVSIRMSKDNSYLLDEKAALDILLHYVHNEKYIFL